MKYMSIYLSAVQTKTLGRFEIGDIGDISPRGSPRGISRTRVQILLYLIYVHDIAACSDSPILSFADDTTLIASHNDPDVLYTSANEEISNLYSWFCSNKLSLNPQQNQIYYFEASKYEILT